MEQHSGWEQPAWFAPAGTEPEYRPSFRRTNWHGPVAAECATVMERVGVIDLTPFAKFYLSGERYARLKWCAVAEVVGGCGSLWTVESHNSDVVENCYC